MASSSDDGVPAAHPRLRISAHEGFAGEFDRKEASLDLSSRAETSTVRDTIVRPPGSTTVQALKHHVGALFGLVADPAVGPLLRNVIAASASDPSIERALMDQWITPRRAAVAVTLRDAVATGELPAHTDVEVAVDALVSPPYYRLMLGMAPLDDAGVAALVNTVWCGCRATRQGRGS